MTKPAKRNGNPNGDFVLLSTPGMHGMDKRIQKILNRQYGLDMPLYQIKQQEFTSLELKPTCPHTIRGQKAFLLMPMQWPNPNIQTMMMYLTCDMLTRASVQDITLVLPFIPYQRQDRKDEPRSPISGSAFFNLVAVYDLVRHIITMDLHTEQAQGFFKGALDNLNSRRLFADVLKKKLNVDQKDLRIVAPDFGSSVRADRFSKHMFNAPVCVFEKKRDSKNVEIGKVIGPSVKGKTVIMYDDMIDTGGTARKAALRIKGLGAKDVIMCATHGIFSDEKSVEEFGRAGIPVYITNTIPRAKKFMEKHSDWLTVVDCDALLADAIKEQCQKGGSISQYM